MREIEGIQFDDGSLESLPDQEKRLEAKRIFYFTVTQIAMVDNQAELLAIWEKARADFQVLYGDAGEEDLHILELELARCVLQKSRRLNSLIFLEEKVDLNGIEQQEIASLSDQSLKSRALREYNNFLTGLANLKVKTDVLSLAAAAKMVLGKMYEESEYYDRDLSKWGYLIDLRVQQYAKKWSS